MCRRTCALTRMAGWGSSTSKHVGSMAADEQTPNGELHRFLVGANLCAANAVICEGDGAAWVPTRRRPRRIDFVAVSLLEIVKVKRCWVASELDVATVRDDHCAVVVDLETMLCLPRAGNGHRRAAKHCHPLMRNLVRREVFQQDLFRWEQLASMLMNTTLCACGRSRIWRRNYFGCQTQGPRKHWLTFRTWTFMDCVKLLRRVKRMACQTQA